MYEIIVDGSYGYEQQTYTRKSDALKNLTTLFRAMGHCQSGISSLELMVNRASKLHIKQAAGTISDYTIVVDSISPVLVKDRALGYFVYKDGKNMEVFGKIADLFKYLWR